MRGLLRDRRLRRQHRRHVEQPGRVRPVLRHPRRRCGRWRVDEKHGLVRNGLGGQPRQREVSSGRPVRAGVRRDEDIAQRRPMPAILAERPAAADRPRVHGRHGGVAAPHVQHGARLREPPPRPPRPGRSPAVPIRDPTRAQQLLREWRLDHVQADEPRQSELRQRSRDSIHPARLQPEDQQRLRNETDGQRHERLGRRRRG